MNAPFLSVVRGAVRVRVRLQPRAPRSRVIGQHGDLVRAQVTAPPIAGKANEALERLLSELADLPRSTARVVQGEKSRDKVVEIATADPGALAARLAEIVGGIGPASR